MKIEMREYLIQKLCRTSSTLTENIKTWDGVIKEDIISPSTQDNISQGGVGEVIFEWLMKEPPKDYRGFP